MIPARKRRLVLPTIAPVYKRIGAAKGQFITPDNIDTSSDEVRGTFRDKPPGEHISA